MCFAEAGKACTGLPSFSIKALLSSPALPFTAGVRCALPDDEGQSLPNPQQKRGGKTLPLLVAVPRNGPTVGRGDRKTTPLRRIHAVQPRRLRVPSPLCGVSPVGLPAPQPSPRNIILAAVLGPQTVDSRTATGHTSGARLSTPHASATLELSGWRRLQAIQHLVPLP